MSLHYFFLGFFFLSHSRDMPIDKLSVLNSVTNNDHFFCFLREGAQNSVFPDQSTSLLLQWPVQAKSDKIKSASAGCFR